MRLSRRNGRPRGLGSRDYLAIGARFTDRNDRSIPHALQRRPGHYTPTRYRTHPPVFALARSSSAAATGNQPEPSAALPCRMPTPASPKTMVATLITGAEQVEAAVAERLASAAMPVHTATNQPCPAPHGSLEVAGLGGQADGPSARGHRGGPGACGPEQGRGGLSAHGPVRAPASADGRLGGLSRRRARADDPASPLTPIRRNPATNVRLATADAESSPISCRLMCTIR